MKKEKKKTEIKKQDSKETDKKKSTEKKQETKSEEEKSTEQTPEDKAKLYDKQTKVLLGIMILLLASAFIAHFIVKQMNIIEYNGMKFTKVKEGETTFYKAPLGYATTEGNVPFTLKLRNNPEDLENIEVFGEIKNMRDEAVISLSPEVSNCTNTVRTVMDLTITLKAFGIETSAATTDKDFAKENNVQLATCKDAKQKTIIVIDEGEENKITKTGDCYTIQITNCSIQEGFERFILEFITNSIV